MIETVFGQERDVALLSHKIRSKDKEIKRYLKIRVKYKETKRDSKMQIEYKETSKDTKNNNVSKTKR